MMMRMMAAWAFFFGCFESWKFHSSDSMFISDCWEHLESQSETMNLMVTAKTQVDLDSMDLVAKEAQTIGASAGMLSQRDSPKNILGQSSRCFYWKNSIDSWLETPGPGRNEAVSFKTWSTVPLNVGEADVDTEVDSSCVHCEFKSEDCWQDRTCGFLPTRWTWDWRQGMAVPGHPDIAVLVGLVQPQAVGMIRLTLQFHFSSFSIANGFVPRCAPFCSFVHILGYEFHKNTEHIVSTKALVEPLLKFPLKSLVLVSIAPPFAKVCL